MHDNHVFLFLADVEKALAGREHETSSLRRQHISIFSLPSQSPSSPGRLYARLLPCLSAEEQKKAGRFHHARDSLLYAAAHALLRLSLSHFFPVCRPADWQFATNRYGRPLLRPHLQQQRMHPPCFFSLSHSWPYIALALTRCGHCGTDIEAARLPADWQGLARMAFHPRECAHLFASSAPERFFLRLWTHREAVCKALGCGLPRGFPLLEIRALSREILLNQRKLSAHILEVTSPALVLCTCILTRRQNMQSSLHWFDFSAPDSQSNFLEVSTS